VNLTDIVHAWDRADPVWIHPSRAVSEDAYWKSGREQAEKLAEVLPAGCRVVDFGCGDGRVTVPLYDLGFQVIGADASSTMLARLAHHAPGIPTVQSTGPDLHERLGRKVDAVVALAVLIHHSRADQLDIIAGLRKAVRKGGLLLLDWPTSDTPEERANWIEVTTWKRAAQDRAAEKLGLNRRPGDFPWAVFRAV
jgi:SAM-dependent methyltransferase